MPVVQLTNTNINATAFSLDFCPLRACQTNYPILLPCPRPANNRALMITDPHHNQLSSMLTHVHTRQFKFSLR